MTVVVNDVEPSIVIIIVAMFMYMIFGFVSPFLICNNVITMRTSVVISSSISFFAIMSIIYMMYDNCVGGDVPEEVDE